MNTLFWLYKTRANSTGEAPIMLRITHSKARVNITLDVRVQEKQWDSTRQKVKGSSEHAEQVNSLLTTFRNKALQAYDVLLKKGTDFTVTDIASIVRGDNKKQVGIIEAFTLRISHMKARLGVDFAKATVLKYTISQKKLQKFIRARFNTADVSVSTIDRKFVADVDQFYRGVLKSHPNTVIKNMQHFKTVLKLARMNGWIETDPFDFYTFTTKETQREFLTAPELEKLVSCTELTPSQQEVRDVFLFQCFTGLAHCDVSRVKQEHVRVEGDGVRWLYLPRLKTGALIHVPLLPVAEKILAKYTEHPRCLETGLLLPVICNQPMNRMLKLIAAKAGITKQVTTHQARHTFATTILLTNGVKMETVSRLLAHRSIRTTQIYGKITDAKVTADLGELGGKLSLAIA